MATTVADTTRLWALVAREFWRDTRRRLRAGPAYRWRYCGRTPERVLIAPPDLRLADPQIAMEIYYGRFPLSGRLVETGGVSPFKIKVQHQGWQRSLHGFRWLRHMRAAETDLACANARALVKDWLTHHGNHIAGVAWEPGVTAKRIIAWLQHSSVVLKDADFFFYRAFLKSLAVQIRYLRSVAREMPCGKNLLRARIALAFAALSLPVPPSALRSASHNLAAELDRQILPDGGHISRNPLMVLEFLADLLPLRQTYANQAEQPPAALVGAVERMLPALRFFRHQEGSLACFNGMGATVPDRIAAILRHDDTAGAPLLHASHSGYERLAIGDVTVIADTGAAPPLGLSNSAHAGCLSFELSSGRRHFIVNAGVDTYGDPELRPLARATAAHSTATINDTSSARFSHSTRLSDLIGTPLIGGPRHVYCERRDGPDRHGFVARHDGYLPRFGLLHEREMILLDRGQTLAGRDSFLHENGSPASNDRQNHVTIRFHLHPDIGLFTDSGGHLVLSADNGDAWMFSCSDLAPQVEESIYFSGIAGPRLSRQFVLSFDAGALSEVHWKFKRVRLAGATIHG
ncbi:heparinase II/III family protein [Aquamicrobium segne]|uniref:Heparinase II/III family protein n=1 Tax=Aquamicrobium segne TaxID=469547 RepID=A0ABW0H0P0_9HYPH